MKTSAWLMLLLMPVLVAGQVLNSQPGFSRAAWLEDYRALKQYLENGYANLEWMKRRVNLSSLDARTRRALAAATNDGEARSALEAFLTTFGDGHLNLREPDMPSPANADAAPPPGRHSTGAAACQRLGFTPLMYDYSLPFTDAPGFQTISKSEDPFTIGTLPLADGRVFGVLRIPYFFPTALALNCETNWEAFRGSLTGACDDTCQEQFHQLVANRLLAQLTAQLHALTKRKLAGLLIDIGGNGGGTQWVEPVARMLAAKPLRAPRLRFIRHPHWVRALQSRLELLEEDLRRPDLSRPLSRKLIHAQRQLRQLLAEAQTRCDQSRIWSPTRETTARRRSCSILNTTPIFTTGMQGYAAPGSLAGLRAKAVLFSPSLYEYQEGAIKLPLIVLVDRQTASAAEYFAAMLQDNREAVIIGEKTYGSGCGYTNGGLKPALPNSKLQVRMPDCARYRRDGGNEVAGITPDLTIWSRVDNETARLEKLLRALGQLKTAPDKQK